jgi:hypothetical protein
MYSTQFQTLLIFLGIVMAYSKAKLKTNGDRNYTDTDNAVSYLT